MADNLSVRRFRVAFSFASEKREFVSEVATILAREFTKQKILYDKFHTSEFARANLRTHLLDLYHNQSDLVVAILCPDYSRKPWTGMEWNGIYDLSLQHPEAVMLCRFEKATTPDLFETAAGFVDLDDVEASKAAALILERLKLNDAGSKNRNDRESDATPPAPTPQAKRRVPNPQKPSPPRRDGVGSQVAWLLPATMGSVVNAVVLSVLPAGDSLAREVFLALVLITPLLAGFALGKAGGRRRWWASFVSGALIGLISMVALYLRAADLPPINWPRTAFWLTGIGALLAFVGHEFSRRTVTGLFRRSTQDE